KVIARVRQQRLSQLDGNNATYLTVGNISGALTQPHQRAQRPVRNFDVLKTALSLDESLVQSFVREEASWSIYARRHQMPFSGSANIFIAATFRRTGELCTRSVAVPPT